MHLGHKACLTLAEDKPNVVFTAACIPVGVGMLDVPQCWEHRVAEVSTPRDALVEKDRNLR